MEITRLFSTDTPLYQNFINNYSSSFPIYEQRTHEQQLYAFSNPEYHLEIYQEHGEYIGFLSYWVFPESIYIEHLAVEANKRGGGYGKKIINTFLPSVDKVVILEIDPVIDEISLRRLRFYQSLGFVTNPWKHIHPPYRKEFPGHELEIISFPALPEEQYLQFYRDLCQIVMKK